MLSALYWNILRFNASRIKPHCGRFAVRVAVLLHHVVRIDVDDDFDYR